MTLMEYDNKYFQSSFVKSGSSVNIYLKKH